jgi:hypothetical protein
MPLVERQRLLRVYRAAVQAYHESVASLDERMFHEALQGTELARNQAEAARIALLKHEHLNVASIGPKPVESASNQISIIGSTVSLFNVNTEHWDLFEITDCGIPPAGALAYVPSAGHEQGRWILDRNDMRQSTTLYLTEAGLNILREAGLEM